MQVESQSSTNMTQFDNYCLACKTWWSAWTGNNRQGTMRRLQNYLTSFNKHKKLLVHNTDLKLFQVLLIIRFKKMSPAINVKNMEVLHRRSNNSRILEKTSMNRQSYLLFCRKRKMNAILILPIHFYKTYYSNASYDSYRIFDVNNLRT